MDKLNHTFKTCEDCYNQISIIEMGVKKPQTVALLL
jgi:hypothetical protein